MKLCLIGGLILVAVVTVVWGANGCNKAICASVVSKCMLIKSCECDMTNKRNCTCCKDCHMCLAKHYLHCCSCVGMCTPPKADENLQKTSSIEDLNDPIPDLFNVLTEEEDFYKRWSIHRYPIHDDSFYYKPVDHNTGIEFSISIDQDKDNSWKTADLLNCTVAFMSQCMSLKKCKDSCKSMGAARYRWFHQHGCCQCIGHTCLDYGLGEEKCLKCPLPEGEEEEELEESSDVVYDYENQIDADADSVDVMDENEMDLDDE